MNADLSARIDHIRSIDFFDTKSHSIDNDRIEGLKKQIGVTRLACVTQLDRINLPVFYAIRPSSRCPSAAYSSGKAFARRNALLGALFESYERWAAEHSDLIISASLKSLFSQEALKECQVFQPEEIPATEAIRWSIGLHLITKQAVLMPTYIVEFPSNFPRAGVFTTTGLASHSSYIGATANGLLECLERHFVARFTLDFLFRIEPDYFSPEANGLAETLNRERIELHVFSLRRGPALSVVYAYAYDHWLEYPQLHCSGFAAAFDTAEAIDKALLEVAQSRIAFITGLRDDVAAIVEPKSFDSRMVNRQREWLNSLRSVERRLPKERREKRDLVVDLQRLLGSGALRNPLIFPLRQAHCFPAVRVLVPELVDCA